MKKQCTEYEFLIAQYVDGEIEEVSKTDVFLHLAECGSCRSFWEAVTELKLQAAKEKRMTAPAGLDRRVAGIAKANAPARKSHIVWRNLVRRRLFVPAPVAIVLALVLLVSGAGMAFAWIQKPQQTREVIEPVVCIKLPTVEVRGEHAQPKQAFR
jgi:predicted anti-sigma-YlaC factor YlaD